MINKKGIGIIEVLVAAGLMSIIGLAVASMISSQQKETKAVSETLGKLDLEKLLISALADGSICSFELTRAPTTFDSTQLSSATPPTIPIPIIHAASSATAPTLVANNSQASSLSPSLVIESITFENIIGAGVTNKYLADLKIKFISSGIIRSLRPISLKMILNTDVTSPATAKLITSCLRAPGNVDVWTVSPMNSDNIFYSTGNVGIGAGATSPNSTLQVDGSITGAAAILNATTTLDFSKGNLQYTNSSCGNFRFDNMKDGATYSFIVKGTAVATCAFNGFSGVGTGALTMHLPPDHGATKSGTHTLYSFVVVGSDVYAAWIAGY